MLRKFSATSAGLAIFTIWPERRSRRLQWSFRMKQPVECCLGTAPGRVEDGYGYRGALEGTFKGLDEVAHELEALDSLFGRIFERAATMHTAAESLAGALAEAMPTASAVSVPRDGGTAHRLIVPALRVPQGGPQVVAAQPDSQLEIPAEQRWSLDGSDSWSPQLPAELTSARVTTSGGKEVLDLPGALNRSRVPSKWSRPTSY